MSQNITLVSNHKPLVQLIKDRFPVVPTKTSDTIEEIMFRAGTQDVIRFLEEQMKVEEQDQLQFK